jgi:hypothetical protein
MRHMSYYQQQEEDIMKRLTGKVVANQEEYVQHHKKEFLQHHKKPPLGLSSKAVCDRNRATQIIEAMLRYAEVDKPIPLSWVQELKERLL